MAARRWIRLDVTWDVSEWLVTLDPCAQLAWIRLLCWVKAYGIGGATKALTPQAASAAWRIPAKCVAAMLEAAKKEGALQVDDGEWRVTKWARYQESDRTAAERKRRQRSRVSHGSHGVTVVTGGVTRHATETETSSYSVNGSSSSDGDPKAIKPSSGDVAPEKPKKRKTPDSWSGRACEIWEQRFGDVPGGRVAAGLKRVVSKYTEAEVLPLWRRYLAIRDPTYASAQEFAAKYLHWKLVLGNGIGRKPMRFQDCKSEGDLLEMLRLGLDYVRRQDPAFGGGWPPASVFDVPRKYREQWNAVLRDACLELAR